LGTTIILEKVASKLKIKIEAVMGIIYLLTGRYKKLEEIN
jgi:hypothetical protein